MRTGGAPPGKKSSSPSSTVARTSSIPSSSGTTNSAVGAPAAVVVLVTAVQAQLDGGEQAHRLLVAHFHAVRTELAGEPFMRAASISFALPTMRPLDCGRAGPCRRKRNQAGAQGTGSVGVERGGSYAAASTMTEMPRGSAAANASASCSRVRFVQVVDDRVGVVVERVLHRGGRAGLPAADLDPHAPGGCDHTRDLEMPTPISF